jgi:hypothetical protein
MAGVSYAVGVLGISYLLGCIITLRSQTFLKVSATLSFDMLLTIEWSVGKKEQIEAKDDFQWEPLPLSEKQSLSCRQLTHYSYTDAKGSSPWRAGR